MLTEPNSISGVSDVVFPGGVLPPGEMGEVVGYYADSNGYEHGFAYDPNAGGFDYPSVDCPGAQNTQLMGINSAGLAVGYWNDSADNIYAFTFDTAHTAPAGGGCVSLPCSDCTALGINDAGWIVGLQFYDSSQDEQGFVYKPGLPLITLQLGLDTVISDINGQGTIAGSYSPDGYNFYGFIGDASQSGLTVISAPVRVPRRCLLYDSQRNQ